MSRLSKEGVITIGTDDPDKLTRLIKKLTEFKKQAGEQRRGQNLFDKKFHEKQVRKRVQLSDKGVIHVETEDLDRPKEQITSSQLEHSGGHNLERIFKALLQDDSAARAEAYIKILIWTFTLQQKL